MKVSRSDATIFQKLDPWLPEDERIMAVGPQAELLYIRGLLYIRRGLREGDIPKYALGEVGHSIARVKYCAQQLVDVGLWDDCGATWRVHQWVKWNMTRDERTERSLVRQQAGKISGHKRYHSVDNPSPTCDYCKKEGWS